MEEYRIPKEIMLSEHLGRKEKLLFSAIYSCAIYNKGVCESTNSEFSKIVGTNVNQITKTIKKLRDKGLISTNYRNRTPIETPDRDSWEFLMTDKKPDYNIIRTIFLDPKYMKRKRRRS